MKILNKVKFIIFTLVILVMPSIVKAEWQKKSTPIVNLAAGGWASESITSPSLIKDKGKWIIFFHSYYGLNSFIGTAESTDMITWITSTDPVLTPDEPNETNVETPTIVKTDKFHMWFLSYKKSLADYKIRYATSDDGTIWSKYPTPVLVPSEDWEIRGVSDPSVIYHDGKYLMFYAGWGNTPWQIGYAESSDGVNWTKSPNNPLHLPTRGHVNGPHISFYDNKYQLFYHTGGMFADHIYHVSSTDLVNWQCEEENCTVIESTPGTFDAQMTLAPFVFTENNKRYMFYGGSDGGATRIGLAVNQFAPEKTKVIIVPGLLSSWNEEAMIHRQNVSYDQWVINPIVKDYSGLIASLENVGYVRNQDYYIFAYDWRKSINSIIADFKIFLNTNNLEGQPLDLVGHSLGGLVSRIYLQQNPDANVKHIVTLGSPHQGTAQVYKTLAGGEFDESNPQLWLAEKLAIQLYRGGIESDRTIFNENLPILADLIATYPYLFDKNGNPIPYEQYQFKNSYLAQLQNLALVNPFLHSFAGTKGDTLYGYKLGPRTIIDKLLNLYPEGRPFERISRNGDLVVPLESAQTENHSLFDLDHGQLVSRKEAISKLFDHLGINYQDDQLVNGEPTTIFPSLLFLVMSPADLEVEIDGQLFKEEMGILNISNPPNGSYTLRAKGKAKGNYTIIVGDLKQNTDSWIRITGEITNDNPETQTDTYHFNYGNTIELSETDLWDQLIRQLGAVYQATQSRDLLNALNSMNLARKYWQKSNWILAKINLLKAQRHLFSVTKHLNNDQLNQLLAINRELEVIYNMHRVLPVSKTETFFLKTESRLIGKLLQQRERYLQIKIKEIKDPQKIALVLNEIYWQRSMIEELSNQNLWPDTKTYLESCKYLLQML